MVQFDTIIFRFVERNFVELVWSVRVDWKNKSHYDSRVSLHEAPTKKRRSGSAMFLVHYYISVHLTTGHLLILKTFRNEKIHKNLNSSSLPKHVFEKK